jgi:hypothetical protein
MSKAVGDWNWSFLPSIAGVNNERCYTLCSESFCALRLRYVDLFVIIEVAAEVCCCFTLSVVKQRLKRNTGKYVIVQYCFNSRWFFQLRNVFFWMRFLENVSSLETYGSFVGSYSTRLYLRGAAKSAVYCDRPCTLNELKTAITAYIRNISQVDLQKVFLNKIKRVQACIDSRGHHFYKGTATFRTHCTCTCPAFMTLKEKILPF